MATKKIEIQDLSQYIKQINKIQNASFYRGEGAIYTSRKSYALRPYEFKWNSAEPYPFQKMIEEFYKETAYKLNEDKVDFIAFAQHHGIPTNLLDITTSPLTALYFACQNNDSDEGVVYVGSNEYIDVTELIHKYPNENLIEKVFSNTTKELMLLMPLFEKFKKDFPNTFSKLLKKLIEDYLYYFSRPFSDEDKKFYSKLKRKKFDIWECTYYMREISEEIKSIPLNECDEEVYFYLVLQYIFLKNAKEIKEPIHTLRFLPNMVYRPVMKFERGRNQQGFFLYQGYMTYIEPAYNFRVLAMQHLHFQEMEIHIKDKQRLLSELDKLGINRKTLFCDYDSIAAYIREKYSILK